jgi:CheY-like chemotaxis protein
MTGLSGTRVFLVEDEGFVALMIEDLLLEFGCELVASVADVTTAIEKAAHVNVDVAMLDVNLAGQTSFPVAAILRERAIPVLFCTGYASTSFPAQFSDSLVLNKPFTKTDLQQKLALTLGRSPG